ncbi:hypothetical protein DRJ25_06000 [Candidatus Woesearchaeota archaeon]|nr:MAG: hypothetical protein DRJ25_06000 [Candidatus Woesearchaeota archaeon]
MMIILLANRFIDFLALIFILAASCHFDRREKTCVFDTTKQIRGLNSRNKNFIKEKNKKWKT